ncbi:uncharacterized protein [Argopecten irradians]|uniref:uncharacterized protein n=1 Tax=Argopecten irradians TaxID=31199 RepID=UPI003711769C
MSYQLKTQTKKLKQELDKLTAETVIIYQKMKEDNANIIKKYKQDLERYEKQLKQQMQECKATLQQGSPIEIYDTDCEIDSRIHLPMKPVLRTACFTPNRNPRKHLELALGTSDNSGQTQGQSSTQRHSDGTKKKAVTSTKLLAETRVVEKWKSPCTIHCICPTTDDQGWTSFCDTLTLLDRNRNVAQKVKHKARINDISLSTTTKRLWACDDQNNILVLFSGHLSERFSTKEEPKCICVTADNHMLIGMSKHISKYTMQGQMVITTEVAGTITPSVCSPWMITACPVTNNIAVIDHGYKNDGGDGNKHVVVMNTDLWELYIYRGVIPSRYKEKTPQTGDEPFDPLGIVYDNQGNVIIADCDNEKIIILNGDGEEQRILQTNGVWVVGVSAHGDLWTVNCDDNVKLLKYC